MAKDSFAFLGFLQPLKIPTELCPRTVDHFWENFSDKLDEVLGKSRQHIHGIYPDEADLPQGFSPKGEHPKSMKGPPKIIFTTVACGSRYQPNSSFRERKLQRRVHRTWFPGAESQK